MQSASKRNSLGRRSFLGTSALTLLAMSNPVLAQAPQAREPAKAERQGEPSRMQCA